MTTIVISDSLYKKLSVFSGSLFTLLDLCHTNGASSLENSTDPNKLASEGLIKIHTFFYLACEYIMIIKGSMLPRWLDTRNIWLAY